MNPIRTIILLGLLALLVLPVEAQRRLYNQAELAELLYAREDSLELIPEVTYRYHVLNHERENSIWARHELYQMVGDGVFRFWGDLRNKVQTLALYTRGIGAFPCFNAHRCTPRSDKDGFWKGGPELPSKKLVKAIPHAADVVYKAEAEVSRKGQNFWTGVYRCEPEDPSYHMKDRHGYRGVVPMNLGELLRAVGYQLPRLPALQWQETVADTIVEQRAEGLAVKDVVTHWADKLNGKVHKLHIRWSIRDGLDRYTIQNMREDSIFAL